ncbi:3-deoxy-D-manno-octulosonic acid transferase [Kiloniella sp. b19]|uniref:3-deoxy-D-manno-octulosonic acid transferase n=1 Tax=Kiloniella sp. GXU_MW_B19 TaxID=3141326 RepID=UPI0031E38C6B
MSPSRLKKPVSLQLYKGLTALLSPLIALHLKKRIRKGKEDARRLPERFGHSSLEREDGKLVWLHGASVGETLSILTLIRKLNERRSDLRFLVTSGTVTSSKLMAERLPDNAVHQFIPVDTFAATRRFLSHWKPDLAILVESELWPNLLMNLQDFEIPALLINARMSERSGRSWKRHLPEAIAYMLQSFAQIHAQSDQDGERFRILGHLNVHTMSNLKYAADPLPFREEDKAALQDSLKGRFVWLAASTHPREEELMGLAHQKVMQGSEDTLPLLLLAPRHPERGDEIARTLRAQGLVVAQRSRDEKPEAGTAVYLLDTLGEMGLWYSLARHVVIGGSFLRRGGQNPLEPARQGSAIFCGAQMQNFETITREMLTSGCLLQATDTEEAEELSQAIANQLIQWQRTPGKAAEMIAKGYEFTYSKNKSLDALIVQISSLI